MAGSPLVGTGYRNPIEDEGKQLSKRHSSDCRVSGPKWQSSSFAWGVVFPDSDAQAVMAPELPEIWSWEIRTFRIAKAINRMKTLTKWVLIAFLCRQPRYSSNFGSRD